MRAIEKEEEQAAWDLWSRMYPLMMAGFIKFKNYKDFRRDLNKPAIKPDKAPKEIEDELMRVVEAYENRA